MDRRYRQFKFNTENTDHEIKKVRVVKKFGDYDTVISIERAIAILDSADTVELGFYRDGGSCVATTPTCKIIFPYDSAGKHRPYAGFKSLK